MMGRTSRLRRSTVRVQVLRVQSPPVRWVVSETVIFLSLGHPSCVCPELTCKGSLSFCQTVGGDRYEAGKKGV